MKNCYLARATYLHINSSKNEKAINKIICGCVCLQILQVFSVLFNKLKSFENRSFMPHSLLPSLAHDTVTVISLLMLSASSKTNLHKYFLLAQYNSPLFPFIPFPYHSKQQWIILMHCAGGGRLLFRVIVLFILEKI